MKKLDFEEVKNEETQPPSEKEPPHTNVQQPKVATKVVVVAKDGDILDDNTSQQHSLIRDASKPSMGKSCLACGSVKHLTKDCDQMQVNCYNCGSPDHRLAACPTRICSLCGDEGHSAT